MSCFKVSALNKWHDLLSPYTNIFTMATATFVLFRHRTNASIGVIDLPMISNTINRSISYEISEGDTIKFSELQEADQVAINRFTKNAPSLLEVNAIEFEQNLEINNGIRKIYLEAK